MDEVEFRARTLKRYAEPVDAAQLVEGEIYFSLTFYDEDMRIPDFKTIVFIGKFTNDQGANCVRFQDFDSYREGIRYPTPSTVDDSPQGCHYPVLFFECEEEHAGNIFEFEKSLEQLMLCSLRRSGVPGC